MSILQGTVYKYVLYNDDVEVASFKYENGVITDYSPIKQALLPMQIRNASADGFSLWLRDRAIDMNTLQHRRLMYELLGSRDKIAVALSTYMFSLSDKFTCFPKDVFIPRKDICSPSDQNEVSSFILVSSDTSLRKAKVATPNASTDGSFVKTWRYEDGEWWLYKLQFTEASRTEFEISQVLRAIGWDAAEYRYQGSYRKRIRTKCFVGENEFFEPYDSFRYIFEDRSDDEDVIRENLSSLGEVFDHAWQRILLADAVFRNTDRHMRNFGVIRSSSTGEVLRLAPNFDNNQAYKANPGGHYSSSMFRAYARFTEYDYKPELVQLIDECRKHPYLAEVVSEIEPFLK